MDFMRRFSEKDIEALQAEKLFTEFLLPDILSSGRGSDSGRVFPAVRKDRMDFYYCGGKLFSFTGSTGFVTHQKYASVLLYPSKQPNVSEAQLGECAPITSFTQDVKGKPADFVYQRTKENCSKFAGEEAEAVSRLYRRFPCTAKRRKGDVVVLDIEVSFKAEPANAYADDEKNAKQDRVDLLLFNTDEKTLRFVEAKSFSNGEIRAKEKTNIKVANQVKRYRSQLISEKNRQDILDQYVRHIAALNALFGINLPDPVAVDSEPCLYIFNFDEDQRDGRLTKDRAALKELGIEVYAKGDPKTISAEALWKKTQRA